MTQLQHFDGDEATGLDTHVYPSGVPSVDYVYKQDPGGQSGTLNPTDFQEKAKQAVALYYNRCLDMNPEMIPVEWAKDPKAAGFVVPSDIFVVWFSKTLQNWKALCSTVFPDGRYFELTYNGDKRELYVDEYVKKGNQVFVEDPNG